jgi:hypothetical protein
MLYPEEAKGAGICLPLSLVKDASPERRKLMNRVNNICGG